ncbi:hypothetical protein MAR_036701 [Mya arenaria]|uniref:Uncharacterized protein n=1 Tax=Mya arenaria TaxID=6604 RepID=A0ABY7FLM0_MYAAR|nr:hypothetical protein MAR_036701 [Mya arenaria]
MEKHEELASVTTYYENDIQLTKALELSMTLLLREKHSRTLPVQLFARVELGEMFTASSV